MREFRTKAIATFTGKAEIYFNIVELGGRKVKLDEILNPYQGEKIKITIEHIEDEKPEETVTVTYGELFNRCQVENLGISIYYLNEGGDPSQQKVITKSQALNFMSESEFEGRKNR
jgi:hypothetical protein